MTGSSVGWIDADQGTFHSLSESGGERVAIGFGWVAWSEGTTLHARRMVTAP